MILDTDVLIFYMRGNENARVKVLESIPFRISVVTYIEIVQGMRNKAELKSFLRTLSLWSVDIIQIDREISQRAMFLMEDFSLSHSLLLADALIAATALERKDAILSANDRHYRFIPNIQTEPFQL